MRAVRASLRVFVYGTEDEARVRSTLLRVLGRADDDAGRASLTRSKIKGHYGTDIVLYEGVVKKPKELQSFLQRLQGHEELRQTLRQEFDQRLDEDRVLHFRLDKQAAVLDRLEISAGGDTIQVGLKYEERGEERKFP
jgi:RNA binding exosome subunit